MTNRYRNTLHDRTYLCDYLLSQISVYMPDTEVRNDSIAFLTELRSEYRHALSELTMRLEKN